jgi:hypothetical protein
MKKVSIVILALAALLISQSCNNIGGDTRSDLVKTKMSEMIVRQSNGLLGLESFKKINGTEQQIAGAPAYEITFSFVFDVKQPCYQSQFFGFVSQGQFNFLVLDHATSEMGQARHLISGGGGRYVLNGRATLIKRENGWEVANIEPS